jgi:hypothetical protein
MIQIEFTYTEGGRWHQVSVTAKEYAGIMNSGMIDGRTLAAVRLWDCDTEYEEHDNTYVTDDHLVYDFGKAKSGQPAWRTEV